MEALDDFGLIPADDPDLTDSAALDAAVASVLGDPADVVDDDAPEPYGMTWIFDFEHGRMVRSGGSPAETRGLGALEQWLQMMLHTALFAHPAVAPGYGIENPDLGIGEVRVGELIGDWERQITEGALMHDRVAEVTDFAADYDPAEGVLTIGRFTVVTDEDETLTIGDIRLDTGAL